VDKRATRKRIVTGLFREVRSNLGEIEKFLGKRPYPEELRQKVRTDANFRPVMIVTETTQFYDSIAASLPDVRVECLHALSDFYDKLRIINKIAETFESKAFSTISPDGREGTVNDLWFACREAEKGGWKALYELELAYPRKWFRDFKS